MADVITRFKLETTQYDSKLRDAVSGMKDVIHMAELAGKDFKGFSDKTLEAAKSLGSIETGATNAKDKVKELVSAYNSMASTYNTMTKAMIEDDAGKALAESLQTLKVRISEAKQELYGMKDSGGFLDSLKDKFTLNVDALKLFSKGLSVAKSTLEMMEGVIESTEAGHDALARTIEVTDSVTNQFLRSLATADFSNFLGGLQDIINKATEAYNTLDEFESFAARFNPYQSAKESEIQTKLQQARAAKAKGDMQRAEQLTQEAKRLIDQLAQSTKAYGEKQTKAGYSTIRSLMGNVEITDNQIAWYADPKNWNKAQTAAKKYGDTINELSRAERSLAAASLSGNQKMIDGADEYVEVLTGYFTENEEGPSLLKAGNYITFNVRYTGDVMVTEDIKFIVSGERKSISNEIELEDYYRDEVTEDE